MGYGVAAVGDGTEGGSASDPQWLFVLTSASGSVEEDPDGGFTITFEDPRERVVQFTDRPTRLAAALPLEYFVSYWDEGETFDEVPPNADLEFLTAEGKQKGMALELTGATLDEGLVFTAEALPGSLLHEPEGTETFVDGTLFIDDAATPPCWSNYYGNAELQGACYPGYHQGWLDGYSLATQNPGPPCASYTGADLAACEWGYGKGWAAGDYAIAKQHGGA